MSTEPESPVSSTPESKAGSPALDPADALAPADKAPEVPAAAGAKRAKVLPLVLGGLCLVLAVVVALLGWWAVSDRNTHKVDEAAVEAARTRAPLVLSYSPATVDQDIETARTQVAGKFAKSFDQLVNQVVMPATWVRAVSMSWSTVAGE